MLVQYPACAFGFFSEERLISRRWERGDMGNKRSSFGKNRRGAGDAYPINVTKTQGLRRGRDGFVPRGHGLVHGGEGERNCAKEKSLCFSVAVTSIGIEPIESYLVYSGGLLPKRLPL